MPPLKPLKSDLNNNNVFSYFISVSIITHPFITIFHNLSKSNSCFQRFFIGSYNRRNLFIKKHEAGYEWSSLFQATNILYSELDQEQMNKFNMELIFNILKSMLKLIQ